MVAERVDTQALKRVDLRDFYQSEVGTGKRSGKALVDRVPWRDDRKPSLNVYPDGWIDRATGDRGNIFALVERLHDLPTFAEQVDYVANRIGGISGFCGTVKNAKTLRPVNRRETVANSQPPAVEWQRRAASIVEAGERALWTPAGESALAYLREHMLTDDTIRAARLGYDASRQAVVIPWYTGGQLWAVKFRRLDPGPDDSKFTQLAGGKQALTLYGADDLQPGKPEIFVEGEIKALVGKQLAGDLATFVTVGSVTGKLPERYRSAVEAAPILILIRDNDEAGLTNAERNTAGLPDHRVVTVPSGKDLNDFATTGADVRGWLASLLAEKRVPLTWVSSGVPDTFRAACNRYLPFLGPVVELIVESLQLELLAPDEPISMSTLNDLAATTEREVSERTIRQAVNLLARQFPTDRPILRSIQEKTPEFPIGQNVGNCTAPGSAGRKSKAARLPSASELIALVRHAASVQEFEACFPADDATVAPIRAAMLRTIDEIRNPDDVTRNIIERYGALIDAQPGLAAKIRDYKKRLEDLDADLRQTASTQLPARWRYRNAQQYKACLIRGQTEAAGGTTRLPQRVLAQRIGCSERRVDLTLTRAGITNTSITHDRVIKTMAEFEAVTGFDHAIKGYPKRVIAQKLDGKTAGWRSFAVKPGERRDELIDFTRSAFGAGHTIIVRYQQTSRQQVTTDSQPEPPKMLTKANVDSRARAENLTKPDTDSRAGEAPSDNIGNEKKRKRFRRDPLGYSPAWVEDQLVKLLALVTSWRRDGDQLIDRDPVTGGEIVPYTLQTVIDLLLGKAPQFLEFLDPEKVELDDPLIAEQIAAGGTVTAIERII